MRENEGVLIYFFYQQQQLRQLLLPQLVSWYVWQMKNFLIRIQSGTSTTSSPLPAQCFSYTTNSDATRNYLYSSVTTCDSSAFSSSGTWVRFVSPAGTYIANWLISTSTCGTSATGWYTGAYPTTSGSTTSGTVCYNWAGSSCNWANSIQITHCDTYYVFLLVPPPVCDLRYCTV